MGFQPRPAGINAVLTATTRGWKIGAILVSKNSWSTKRVITGIESWCIRLRPVMESTEQGVEAVYKALPLDVRELLKDDRDRTQLPIKRSRLRRSTRKS